MSTLGMRPRRGQHSDYASPISPRASTNNTWEEQLPGDAPEKTSGQDAFRAPEFHDTEEEHSQNAERTQNQKQEEDTEEAINKSKKEAEEDEEIIQQLFRSSHPAPDPHTQKSVECADTSSESIDESEEEIRQTIENFKRRDATRRSTRYTGIDAFRPSALWKSKSDTQAREKKLRSKFGGKAKTEGTKQPQSSYFKFWTWNWRGPKPIDFIPIPPPYHPENLEPEIVISYTCGHRLPTRIIPSSSSLYPPPSPNSPSPSPSTTTAKSPLPPLPSSQIEILRATAQKEGLRHLVTPQDSLCPNCFIWYEWFVGLCLLICFWVLWGYFFSFIWPETWWVLRNEKEGWRWTPKRFRVVVNFDTSGGGRVSY
ncbi:56ad19be-bcf0-4ef5-ba28-2ee4746d762b [Sclerotinia trifoliorum]|uniref:56ad19be-bcf0-4ef5-ba28-2ee4746d762b n=1 Tax=Sclerotinia trifoliorum TaxID=28548 RepID=A0A8H2W000_9HELO|nr:56ad19be-bcf0-4ef5-ba28-2ee4746d762b [Sclerotinia trifoliorum]